MLDLLKEELKRNKKMKRKEMRTKIQILQKKDHKNLQPKSKRSLIRQSLSATWWKLDPNYWKHTFELFGYDFIVDNDFNLWLIEVNTNPCIEESSELLKHLLRWMLEDMTKLVVDPLFPKPRLKKKKSEKYESKQVTNNLA